MSSLGDHGPRPRKKRKGNKEGVGGDVFSEEVKVEALVAVKQDQEGNPQENNVEEIFQAEESAMSMVLKEMRSLNEKMEAAKEEMVNRSEGTGAKFESVFEELISVKDELREARKEIETLEKKLEGYKFQS